MVEKHCSTMMNLKLWQSRIWLYMKCFTLTGKVCARLHSWGIITVSVGPTSCLALALSCWTFKKHFRSSSSTSFLPHLPTPRLVSNSHEVGIMTSRLAADWYLCLTADGVEDFQMQELNVCHFIAAARWMKWCHDCGAQKKRLHTVGMKSPWCGCYVFTMYKIKGKA